MVRRDDLRKMDAFTELIAECVRVELENAHVTQQQCADMLGRSQAYVSIRLRGIEARTTNDLNNIAQFLGYTNAFTLLDRARGVVSDGDASV